MIGIMMNFHFQIFMKKKSREMLESLSQDAIREISSSARKIGSTPVYIQPKELESSHGIVIESFKNIHPDMQSNNQLNKEKQQPIQVQQIIQQQSLFSPPKLLLALEVLIYICFIITSYSVGKRDSVLMIADICCNGICLIKIVGVHVWLWMRNKNEEQGKQKLPKRITIINKIQVYELIQLFSLILTILILGYGQSTLVGSLLNSLKTLRLLFPFFIMNSSTSQCPSYSYMQVMVNILKVVCFCFCIILWLTFTFNQYVYNSDRFYCMKDEMMVSLYSGGEVKDGQDCGIQKECSKGRCVNVFSFISMDSQVYSQQIKGVKKRMGINLETNTNIVNLFVAMIGTASTTSSSVYQHHQQLLLDEILVLSLIVIHFLFFIMLGVGVGFLLRKFPFTKKQKNLPANLSAALTFQKNKQIKNVSQNKEFSFTSPQDIQQQFNQLPIRTKLSATLYNILILVNYSLVLADDLPLSVHSNLTIGIILVVIFIFWTFALALALYEHFAGEEDSEESPQYEINSIKKYLLIFELVTYLMTLLDYILRIISGKYILESSSPITSFSHTLISLRLIYVLYNNVLFPTLSYYTQVLLTVLYWNKNILLLLTTFSFILGSFQFYFAAYLLQNRGTFGEFVESFNMAFMLIFMVGYDKKGGHFGQTMNMCILVLGYIISFCIVGGLTENYLKNSLVNKLGEGRLEVKEELKEAEEKKNVEENKKQAEQNSCKIRILIYSFLESNYYFTIKIIVLLVSFIIPIAFFSQLKQGQMSTLLTILLLLDIVLIIDLILLFISSKIKPQPTPFFIFTIFYFISFIYLLVAYGLNSFIYKPIDLLLRSMRIIILLGMVDSLSDCISRIKISFYSGNSKIVTLLLISVVIVLALLPSTSIIQSSINKDGLFARSLEYSIMVVYYNNFKLVESTNENYTFSVLSILFVFLIVLVIKYTISHSLIRFWISTSIQEKNEETIIQNFVKQYYLSFTPSQHHYQTVSHNEIYSIIKYIKAIICFVSLLCLCLLTGDLLPLTYQIIPLASFHMFFLLVHIFLFLIQELCVRKGEGWNIWEMILIVVSIPGSFVLFFPTIIHSSGTNGMRIMLRILMMLTGFHILILPSLLMNRNTKSFNCRSLREIYRLLPFKQIGLLLLIYLLICVLFWSYLLNIDEFYSVRNFSYLNLLELIVGSFMESGSTDKGYYIQRVIVLWLMGLISFYMKMHMIAVLIYPYVKLAINYSQSTEVRYILHHLQQNHDRIVETQVTYQIKYKEQGYSVKYNRFYKIFTPFYRIICAGKYFSPDYSSMKNIFSLTKIPIYQYQNEENKEENGYVLLLHDIIMHLYFWKRKLCMDDRTLTNTEKQGYVRSGINSEGLQKVMDRKQKLREIIEGIRERRKNN